MVASTASRLACSFSAFSLRFSALYSLLIVLFPALIFSLVLASALARTVLAMWIVPTDTPAALATSGVV